MFHILFLPFLIYVFFSPTPHVIRLYGFIDFDLIVEHRLMANLLL